MPIYEYHCEHCGDFEEMRRITDPPLTRCPRCNRKVQRLISQTSFQLKGSGWYATDYGRGGAGGKKKEGSDDELAVLRRERKRRLEAARAYREGGREDLADGEESEAKLIGVYLPAELSDEELQEIVERAVRESGAESAKDMGRAMGRAMAAVDGRADGVRVSGLVKAALDG